jgi:hypothetical protein
MVAVAAGLPWWVPEGQDGEAMVREGFAKAKKAGLLVARVYGHGSDENFVLQPKPGVYDERVFKGIDKVGAGMY